MNEKPVAVLHTRDPVLKRRVLGYLDEDCDWRCYEDPATCDRQARSGEPQILYVDIRTRQGRDVLHLLNKNVAPACVIIALIENVQGPEKEPPACCFAALDVNSLRTDFQQLNRQALQHVRLLYENLRLREEQSVCSPLPPTSGSRDASSSLGPFLRAARHFDQPEALLERVVEALAGTARVLRAGVFIRMGSDPLYRCAAGLHPLEDSRNREYTEDAPLVEWMRTRAHLVARSQLSHLDAEARLLLRRTLDIYGADVLLPMHGRSGLIGWIFLGPRSTGQPFDTIDYEELVLLADHVAITLENARLYEEAADQHSRAEALLQTMPSGLIVAEPNGIVRWYNQAAEHLLHIPSSEIVGQPVEQLGGPLADVLHRAMEMRQAPEPVEWRTSAEGLLLRAEAHPITRQGRSLGAMVMLYDRTQEILLRGKQEQVERRGFWIDLAAAMSHEVRNPLVAIKTFAQLLPSRYEDESFRNEFADLFNREIERLDGIVERIHQFAHPRMLEKKVLAPSGLIHHAIEEARLHVPEVDVEVVEQCAKNLPELYADETALKYAVEQLVLNALEALRAVDKPVLRVCVSATHQHAGGRLVMTFEDNGPGVSPELLPKVFSPFCTSKPAGMGLGLAMVRRTVLDHDGSINVESSDLGTRVVVEFPAHQREAVRGTAPVQG